MAETWSETNKDCLKNPPPRSTNILNAFAKDDFAVLEDLDDGVRVSRFLGFLLDALAAVFSHTKAAESVLTKNYEEHVNALVQYFELDFGRHGGAERQRAFFKQVRLQSVAANVVVFPT